MIDIDRSVLNKEHDLGSHTMSEEELIAFSRALGETNPRFVGNEAENGGSLNGIIAPPSFYALCGTEQQMPEPKLQFHKTATGMLAGESCEYFKPVKPGDVISAKCRYTDVFEKTGRIGRMIFVTRETTFTNQHGEMVLKLRESTAWRLPTS